MQPDSRIRPKVRSTWSEASGWKLMMFDGIDALTGAMRVYPDIVRLALVPSSFTSVDEHGAYFTRRAAAIESDAADAVTVANKQCGTNPCDLPLATIERTKKERLAELEGIRIQTKPTP